MRRYSTLRNDLPFLVWQRYFTKASPAPVVIRSRSKCPMKSTCVSQHCFLKALLLMWSSPAALVKVKLSASSMLKVSKSFFSHAAYHLRMISSFVKPSPPNPLPLPIPATVPPPFTPPAPLAIQRISLPVAWGIAPPAVTSPVPKGGADNRSGHLGADLVCAGQRRSKCRWHPPRSA